MDKFLNFSNAYEIIEIRKQKLYIFILTEKLKILHTSQYFLFYFCYGFAITITRTNRYKQTLFDTHLKSYKSHLLEQLKSHHSLIKLATSMYATGAFTKLDIRNNVLSNSATKLYILW